MRGGFMRYWPWLITLTISFSALATRTYQTRIHEIDLGMEGEETLVLLETGDVAKLPSEGDKDLILSLYMSKYNQQWLNITVDDERFITAMQSTKAPFIESSIDDFAREEEPYTPSVLDSYDRAHTIFKNLNSDYRNRSQCYNRAQIWSFESFKKYELKSMKVFLFFTRKYIRNYNYEWWFHVSPFTYVQEEGVAVEKVLDYEFLNHPINMKNWTDIFMRNDVVCPEIQKYSDYSENQSEEYCYLYKTSMFYYQPLDLRKKEETGAEKTNFVSWEVNNAYSQGFGGWW
jgi:Glutaminase